VATIDDRSWRVRWTAAAKFADVVRAFDQLPDTMDSLVPAYEKLLQDPEAEVRTAATFNLAHVARCPASVRVLAPNSSNNNNMSISSSTGEEQRVSVAERLVKRVTNLTEDDSEHVRAALAMVATELAPVLGKDATITYLVPPVLLLLRDAASEVRLNLISSLSALNEVIGVDLLSQSLLPAILDLAQDGKWRIRLAIIQHIPLLAKQLGKEFFTEKLSSLCVGWLGDAIASIRIAAAANLRELTALFGTEWAIDHLLPSIIEIRENPSYLRRLTALQACARMATVMEPEAARMEILPLVMDMAADVVRWCVCWLFVFIICFSGVYSKSTEKLFFSFILARRFLSALLYIIYLLRSRTFDSMLPKSCVLWLLFVVQALTRRRLAPFSPCSWKTTTEMYGFMRKRLRTSWMKNLPELQHQHPWRPNK